LLSENSIMNRCMSFLHGLSIAFLLFCHTLISFPNPAFAAPAPGATAQKIPPIEMTLADAIAVALRSNRDVKTAYLNRVVQKFDLRVARDKFNPDINFTASPEYSSSATRTFPGGTETENTDLSLNSTLTATKKIETGGNFTFTWNRGDQWPRTNTGPNNRSDVNTWKIGFSQPLLKGTGIDVNTASVTLAEFNEQSNLLGLRDSISHIVNSTIGAFRSYAQSARKLDIIKASLQRAKELLEINKFYISVGRMAANEIIQTESDVANQEFSYESALNSLDNARLNLLKVLDLSKSTMITPKEEKEPAAVHPDFSTCLGVAFKNRKDFLDSKMNLEKAKINLTLAENNMLWDLNFNGSYAITDSNQRIGFDSDTDRWGVGLSLNIPIYGELTRKQGLVSSQTSLKQTQLQLEEITENITIEVKDAIREVETKLKQVGMAKRARELSEKKLEVEREKLKVGRTTNFQLVSFQNQLVEAQNAELDANIAFLDALTSLDTILGTTLDTWRIDYNKENDQWPGK